MTPSDGSRWIDIQTPRGVFRVWTRRVGENPSLKVLLLHGGPGGTPDYLEVFDDFLPARGIEYYYYAQLGSIPSEQPDEPSLWNLPRFVDEVEQVRTALGLDAGNFVLFGQSWGGLLAIEYALAHQAHLKGLIISNMMSSVPAYNAYARGVLLASMPEAVQSEILAFEAAGDFENPRYLDLLLTHHYPQHVLRMPPDQWPEAVQRTFSRMNPKIYIPMQGPSEFGAAGDCLLKDWNRSADLPGITVPTLVMGARYDTMNPEHLRWMATRFPAGRYVHCPRGSHLSLYDDQEVWFGGLVGFLESLSGTSLPSPLGT
jgi:proline iminopeptidase